MAKIIGIVGGVGPQAGVDLHSKIIQFTEASKDQEHLSIIHAALPSQISDRSSYLLDPHRHPNPADAVYQIIETLHHAGVQVVGIPCNTCHAPPIFSVIQQKLLGNLGSKVKLLHMIDEVCQVASDLKFNKLGLLATQGTYNSQLYLDIFQQQNIQILHPVTEERCRRVHSSIYDPDRGIKANSKQTDNEFARSILIEEAQALISAGAQAIIMGCTEIPLVLRQEDFPVPLLDATAILAQALISHAMGDDHNH